MTRFPLKTCVLVAIGAWGLLGSAGCRSTTDGPPISYSPGATGAVRVVNGVTDSTSVSASVSGTGANANQIALDSASALLALPTGQYVVQMQPDHGSAFAVNGVKVAASTLSTVVANGVLANGTQNGFVASETLTPPATGQIAVQPVFGAYAYAGGTQNNVYNFSFTSLGGTTQASFNEDALYGQSPPTLVEPSGPYRLQVTSRANCPANQSCPASVGIVFDSGAAHGVMLPATNSVGANVVQVVAVDATGAQRSQYGSSVVLLLLDGSVGVTPIYSGQ